MCCCSVRIVVPTMQLLLQTSHTPLHLAGSGDDARQLSLLQSVKGGHRRPYTPPATEDSRTIQVWHLSRLPDYPPPYHRKANRQLRMITIEDLLYLFGKSTGTLSCSNGPKASELLGDRACQLKVANSYPDARNTLHISGLQT